MTARSTFTWPLFGPNDTAAPVGDAAANGYAQGFQKGVAEGRQQGQIEAMTQTEDLRSALADSLAEIQRVIETSVIAHEDRLTRMVRAMVQALLDHELRTNPDVLNNLIERCLQQLSAKPEDCCVLIHPDELAWVKPVCTLKVRGDESLARGTIQVTGMDSMAEFNAQRLVDEIFGDARLCLSDDR